MVGMNWRPNGVGLGFARVVAMLTKIRNKYDDYIFIIGTCGGRSEQETCQFHI